MVNFTSDCLKRRTLVFDYLCLIAVIAAPWFDIASLTVLYELALRNRALLKAKKCLEECFLAINMVKKTAVKGKIIARSEILQLLYRICFTSGSIT